MNLNRLEKQKEFYFNGWKVSTNNKVHTNK